MVAKAEEAFGKSLPSGKYLSIKVAVLIPATARWKVFQSLVLPGLCSMPALLLWAKACPLLLYVRAIPVPEPRSFGGSAQGQLRISVKSQVWASVSHCAEDLNDGFALISEKREGGAE